MKLGKTLIVALFALFVIGAIFVAAQENKAAVSTSASSDVFTVQPMAQCTRVCSWCLPLGHSGACTTSGACC